MASCFRGDDGKALVVMIVADITGGDNGSMAAANSGSLRGSIGGLADGDDSENGDGGDVRGTGDGRHVYVVVLVMVSGNGDDVTTTVTAESGDDGNSCGIHPRHRWW